MSTATDTYEPGVGTFSLTAGGTAQQLLAADPTRIALFLQPLTEACYINFGTTAGVQATGTLTAGANLVNTETIAVNGVTFTFVTGASTTTNVHIGAAKEDTMTNFAAVLSASTDTAITAATYSVNGAILTITNVLGGTIGNSYTLANSSGTAAITRSAATLTGGLNTGNGIYLAQYQAADFSAYPYASVKDAVYIVSATTAAQTSYLVGRG